MASISWCNAEMALQLIRRCILSQLGTSGVSLAWGANVIARLGEDLEKLPMPCRFQTRGLPADENSNGRGVVRDAPSLIPACIEWIAGLSIYIWIFVGLWGGGGDSEGAGVDVSGGC